MNNPSEWDDTELLNIFHKAVNTHRTKNQKEKSITVEQTAKKRKLEEPAVESTQRKAPSAATIVWNTPSSFKPQRKGATTESNCDEKASSVTPINNMQDLLEAYENTYSTKTAPTFQKNNGESSGSIRKENSPIPAQQSTQQARHIRFQEETETVPSNEPEPVPTAFEYNQSNYPPVFPSINPMIDEAMQSMLMAWYQCGYTTARYQTLMETSMYSGYYPTHESSTSNDSSSSSS